jgi:hypothetical protein
MDIKYRDEIVAREKQQVTQTLPPALMPTIKILISHEPTTAPNPTNNPTTVP